MLNWEIISQYTREDAISDGTLIDVSTTAKEAGFRVPVAVTHALWHGYIVPSEETPCQDTAGRLWDVLSVLNYNCRIAPNKNEIIFDVIFIMKVRQRRRFWLKAIIGPGDHSEPVITIMLPSED